MGNRIDNSTPGAGGATGASDPGMGTENPGGSSETAEGAGNAEGSQEKENEMNNPKTYFGVIFNMVKQQQDMADKMGTNPGKEEIDKINGEPASY